MFQRSRSSSRFDGSSRRHRVGVPSSSQAIANSQPTTSSSSAVDQVLRTSAWVSSRASIWLGGAARGVSGHDEIGEQPLVLGVIGVERAPTSRCALAIPSDGQLPAVHDLAVDVIPAVTNIARVEGVSVHTTGIERPRWSLNRPGDMYDDLRDLHAFRLRVGCVSPLVGFSESADVSNPRWAGGALPVLPTPSPPHIRQPGRSRSPPAQPNRSRQPRSARHRTRRSPPAAGDSFTRRPVLPPLFVG
jgi:hypothetical protein